jgi:hypothetical protein
VSSVGAGSKAGIFVGQILNVATFHFCGQFSNIFLVSQEACGVAQLLGHCAPSRKVAGSIPDVAIDLILSTAQMALDSTQPLTEVSTRDTSLGAKAADA